MNKLQFNHMATTVLFAVLVLVPSVALAQKPIKRPPKKVRQTTTQQVAKPPKKQAESITSAKPTATFNGHEYVDLGLSVLWATKNVGANAETDNGIYYAWGETSPKLEYTYENSKTLNEDIMEISGLTEYDAARVNWGGKWRIPTKLELEELINGCTWKWERQGGKAGYKVTASNGNSIFLPATGLKRRDETRGVGEGGAYWVGNSTEGGGWGLVFQEDFNRWKFIEWDRYDGFVIRPVADK